MNQILRHLLAFVLFAFLQIVLFDHMSIGQVATPFPFLLFLLLLPLNLSRPVLFLLAFGVGLFIDIFTLTYGLHAFAALLSVGLRQFWLGIIAPSSFRSVEEIPFEDQGLVWIASYLFPLIFVHHLAFFSLEALGSGFQNFFFTIFKILGSSLYTFILCIIIFGIFYQKRR
jgi:hypothetical protein